MTKRLELTNQRFGYLLVLKEHSKDKNHKIKWLALCNCGNQTVCYGSDLIRGKVVSCGCYALKTRTKHGNYKKPEYKVWSDLKQRCQNPNHREYKNYGGRGIKVCDRWNKSIENFLADMNERPSEQHSIDRIDVNGHYSCGKCQECMDNDWLFNCRWVLPDVQANNRRTNHYITYNQTTKTVTEWAREIEISPTRLIERLETGWSLEKALTTPGQSKYNPITNPSWLTFQGQTKRTSQWAKELGLTRSLIEKRLEKGWTVEKTLSTPRIEATTYTFNGKTQTVKQWEEELGLAHGAIANRIEQGWDLEKVFTTRGKPTQTFEFNGEIKRVSEWAKHFGVNRNYIYRRLSGGKTIDEILIALLKKQS